MLCRKKKTPAPTKVEQPDAVTTVRERPEPEKVEVIPIDEPVAVEVPDLVPEKKRLTSPNFSLDAFKEMMNECKKDKDCL
jgi:hypothetical protein